MRNPASGRFIILAAATMGGVREGTDFFPLTVDYEERICRRTNPWLFFRREGKPALKPRVARPTDRPLRPLFPEGMRNEVQVGLCRSPPTLRTRWICHINAASAAR